MFYTLREVRKELVLMLVLCFALGWYFNVLWNQYQQYKTMKKFTRLNEVSTFLIKLEDEIDAKIRLYRQYVKVEARFGNTGRKW